MMSCFLSYVSGLNQQQLGSWITDHTDQFNIKNFSVCFFQKDFIFYKILCGPEFRDEYSDRKQHFKYIC